MLRLLSLTTLLVASTTALTQTWTHDFESTGGYITSHPECTDNSSDYFIRTDGSNIGTDPTGVQGSFYFGGQDLDASGCPNISGARASITFDDINISGCSGLSLQFLAASIVSGTSGWDDSDYAHIEYQLDNSGTWVNLMWFEGTGGFNTVPSVDTDFNGTGDGTALTTAFQNFTAAIAGTGALIDIRVEMDLDADSEEFFIDNIRLFGTGCGGGPAATLTAGAITGGPFSVDCSTDDNGTIAFSATGTFNAGNTFTVQLSDASGSFASPTTIGTLSGATAEGVDPSSTINITIPAATNTGAGYQIRIISSNPGITSGNSTGTSITLTSSCTPPHITSVIINSCNPSCSEGYNELVFGTTGDYSINVTNSNFNISYGSNAPPSSNTNYTDDLVTNATTTATLNTLAGCPGTYIDATGTTIPPGASFMMAHNGLCTDALTWSGLCPAGPIYVIYTNDTDWNTNGTFKNGSSGGLRYFNSSMTTTDGSTFNIDYNYNSTSLQSGSSGDGDYVTFNSSGGAPQSYGDNDCILTPTVLPVELIGFYGKMEEKRALLYWQTASEINADYFEIHKSYTGYQFELIGMEQASGNSQHTIDYRFIDEQPRYGVNYYQLIGVDFDGTRKNHGIVALHMDQETAFYDVANGQIVLQNPANVFVYSMDGKIMARSNGKSIIPFTRTGLYYLIDIDKGTKQKFLIH